MPRPEDLTAALAALAPSGPAEEDAAARLAVLLSAAPDPFDRAATAPGHVTASAFVLHPEGDRLLLVWHRKLQRWLQPGGHVEPSDPSVLSAALREVLEETGITAEPIGAEPFDVDVHAVDHDGAEHLHFDVRFLVRGTAGAAAGDGVDAVRWATAPELAAMEESLARPARKALGSAPDLR